MRLLKEGAEARLYQTHYLGKKVVTKQRQRKAYREKSLDDAILMERIRSECNLLSHAKKAGIRTPAVRKIDLKAREITVEFIEGKTLKEELLGKKTKAKALCEQAGTIVGKLHKAGLVHGDLTTSNFILHNKVLVLLDFGLGEISQKLEDRAVDILAFKKTFLATHYSIQQHWNALERAYLRAFSGGKAVLSHLKEVEARARYY